MPSPLSYYYVVFNEVVDYPVLLAEHASRPDVDFLLILFIPLLGAGFIVLLRFLRMPYRQPYLALSLCFCAILFNGTVCLGTASVTKDGTVLKTEQTIHFDDHVYHLTSAETIGESANSPTYDYIIYECDTAGKFCRAIDQGSWDRGFSYHEPPYGMSLETHEEALYLHIRQEVVQVAP